MGNLTEKRIETMIYVIRGKKVMLDSDLADLYQVETRSLNQSVHRNPLRFPNDFCFQITQDEYISLRSQFVIFKEKTGARKYRPYVFTENGIAMLSSVLKSETAILVNVAIMRVFTQMRDYLAARETILERVGSLEKNTSRLFKIVFERLDAVEEDRPILSPKRKKIGFS